MRLRTFSGVSGGYCRKHHSHRCPRSKISNTSEIATTSLPIAASNIGPFPVSVGGVILQLPHLASTVRAGSTLLHRRLNGHSVTFRLKPPLCIGRWGLCLTTTLVFGGLNLAPGFTFALLNRAICAEASCSEMCSLCRRSTRHEKGRFNATSPTSASPPREMLPPDKSSSQHHCFVILLVCHTELLWTKRRMFGSAAVGGSVTLSLFPISRTRILCGLTTCSWRKRTMRATLKDWQSRVCSQATHSRLSGLISV
jgi:hypothetical protein